MILRAIVLWCLCLTGASAFTGSQQSEDHNKPWLVSIVRLIANPQSFNGRRVRVAGYLDNNGLDRSMGVYLSETDGHNFIVANSIDLHIDEAKVERLREKYVVFDATYHSPKGPMADVLNGYLDGISDLRAFNQGDLPK